MNCLTVSTVCLFKTPAATNRSSASRSLPLAHRSHLATAMTACAPISGRARARGRVRGVRGKGRVTACVPSVSPPDLG